MLIEPIMSKNNYDLIGIWHSDFKENKISDPNPGITGAFLDQNFPNRIIIRNSLSKGGKSQISFYKNNIEEKTTTFMWMKYLPNIFRYLIEPILILFYLIKYGKNKTIFSIDPLSSLVPCMLKKNGYIKKVFFLTPDFSKGKRFNNAILNKVYFTIDKFCTEYANVNICNAKSVIDYKKILYPNIKSSKFFHMPNIPPQWLVDKYKNITKVVNKVIYVGNLSADINIDGFKKIFNVVSNLKNKISTLQLVIVGDGVNKEYLMQIAKDKKNIIFLGKIDFESVLKNIAESEIGIAIYNGDNPYDEFRDSLKIREYQSLGVIPIASAVVKSNSEEIKMYNSGILIDSISENLLDDAIEKILTNAEFKVNISNNAINNHLIYSNKYSELKKLILCI